jgi:hypothetical protein
MILKDIDLNNGGDIHRYEKRVLWEFFFVVF